MSALLSSLLWYFPFKILLLLSCSSSSVFSLSHGHCFCLSFPFFCGFFFFLVCFGGYVAVWFGEIFVLLRVPWLFVHCSEAKTLTLISQLESACMHFSYWVLLFLALSFPIFHLFLSLSGTLSTVCVLYTQGVETKQWREVSTHTNTHTNE